MNALFDGALGDAGRDPSPAPRLNRRRTGRLRRALDTATAYLPLLLMAALALGTWWLVKNTPMFDDSRAAPPPRHEPDYSMTQFMVQRFAADGALRAQIEGDRLRHYPDTDTLEIDNPRIRATGDDGRVTVATAREALSNHDGSEVRLTGGARVVREAVGDDPAIEFRGESLHYWRFAERVESATPVVVTQGSTEVAADAMTYDHRSRVVDLKGHVRAVLEPPPRRAR